MFAACALFAGAGGATEQASLNFDTYLVEGHRQKARAAARVGAQARLSSYDRRRNCGCPLQRRQREAFNGRWCAKKRRERCASITEDGANSSPGRPCSSVALVDRI